MNMTPEQARDQDRYEALMRSLTNQSPSEGQIARIEDLRDVAKTFGSAILGICPNSRERSLALTHLEETTMWAVKSIVLEES